MTDVLVVGGGPAGAIAALVLARAGVDVTVFDRARFPRDKLCGDSLNPGAMAVLAAHGLATAVAMRGLPIAGMLLTGPGRAGVRGRYPDGHRGCSIRRRHLDALLIEHAARAGARVEQGTRVAGPLVNAGRDGRRVEGVRIATRAGTADRAARVVIAADGRRSTLAFALGLGRHPGRPRRWAIGAYFEGIRGLSDFGEMHVRQRHYLGVAPVPGDLANVCLVVSEQRARAIGRGAAGALEDALRLDALLADRAADARRVSGVTVLGPLAVETAHAGVEGLLLAGDAGGFIDPITGDGIHLAMRSGELAAAAALEALAGRSAAHLSLGRRRNAELGDKLRVNRWLRALVDVPAGIALAAGLSRVWPSAIASLIRYAGDVPAGDAAAV